MAIAGKNVNLFHLHPDVQQLQLMKQLNAATIEALKPSGTLEAFLFSHTADILFPFVQEFMPFWTGTSWAAQRIEIVEGELAIYTDEGAVNPVSHTAPTEYLPQVFERRGESPYVNAWLENEAEVVEVLGESIKGLPWISGSAQA